MEISKDNKVWISSTLRRQQTQNEPPWCISVQTDKALVGLLSLEYRALLLAPGLIYCHIVKCAVSVWSNPAFAYLHPAEMRLRAIQESANNLLKDITHTSLDHSLFYLSKQSSVKAWLFLPLVFTSKRWEPLSTRAERGVIIHKIHGECFNADIHF